LSQRDKWHINCLSLQILQYTSSQVRFLTYDPAVIDVAQILREVICRVEPRLQVEHIGSTSVPGCGGKGIVDLAILYPTGLLSIARDALDGLGFQRQGGPEPWPEERPMRVGCVELNDRAYRIHAHIIARDCTEHHELIWFREHLRRDPAMRRNYEARKQSILADGTNDSLEYCKAKAGFINAVLRNYQPACATI
jgi:GrpB-like predicted nucleotidyltransferase (UPF0157 family)